MKQEENVCAKCACFRAKGLRCKNQPLGITHPETESCSRFEERCPELPEPPKMKQFKVIINEEK